MIYKEPRFTAAGDQFLVMEIGSDMGLLANCKVIELNRLLSEENMKGVFHAVPSWRSLMVQYDCDLIAYEDLKKELLSIWNNVGEITTMPSRIIEIPLRYGGKYGTDFTAQCEYNDVTEEEYITLHSGELQWVGLVGFVPGHPFIRPLRRDRQLQGRIYTVPRTYTEQGVVAMGGVTTTIYTVPTSGGYAKIAYMPVELYDPFQIQPDFQNRAALLQSGDRIQFCPIDDEEVADIRQQIRERSYHFKIQEGMFDVAAYLEGGLKK